MIRIPTHRAATHPGEMLLERFLGISAGFWMDLQLRWDLYHAHEQDRKDLESIGPYTAQPRADPQSSCRQACDLRPYYPPRN